MFERRRSWVAGGVLGLLVVLCVVGPWLLPHAPETVRLDAVHSPPSLVHPLGTDDLGRDILVRLLHGGRTSLFIGLLAGLLATVAGTLVGGVAGFAGGWIDGALMRLTDVAYSVPAIPLLMVLASLVGTDPASIAATIGILSWMGTARVVRGEVRRLREMPFIEAARSYGAGPQRILLHHLLPNTVGPIAVSATLAVGNAVLAESAISFFGLGVRPPTPTWGNMLMDAQASMALAPWLTLAPGLAILVTVLAVNLLGEDLTERVDAHGAQA